MLENKSKKIPELFECKSCYYNTSSKKDFKKRKRGYRKEKVLRKKEKKLEKEGEIKARSRKQKRWRTR